MKKYFDKIHKVHLKQLRNLNEKYDKLLICFSGVPGSGKTHIAKILEKRYKGVRLSSDDIRKIIDELGLIEDYIEHLLHKYFYWLLSIYPYSNKLIILDKSIDRDYKKIFSLAKKEQYKIFVIRIKASSKIIRARLAKQKRTGDGFNKKMRKWIDDYNEFGGKYKPDVVIDNNKKLNLKALYSKLDKIIKQAF
jgi:predicted kinase